MHLNETCHKKVWFITRKEFGEYFDRKVIINSYGVKYREYVFLYANNILKVPHQLRRVMKVLANRKFHLKEDLYMKRSYVNPTNYPGVVFGTHNLLDMTFCDMNL